MTAPNYGFIFLEGDTDPRPAVFSDMSVLGICLPSDDADASAFPLNTPVDINTGEPTILAKMGTGDLYKYVNLINNQLADLQVSARAVVVRVAKGATIDDTIANIVGDPAQGSGVYAFLRSAQLLGVIPRLLGAPGYTGKHALSGATTSASSAAVAGNAGNGTLALASPSYTSLVEAGVYEVRFTDATHFDVTDPLGEALPSGQTGVAYTTQIKFTISAGLSAFEEGDGFNVTVTQTGGTAQANPICAALPAICDALLAHAVVGAFVPGDEVSKTREIAWRSTISSRRLIPVGNWIVAGNGEVNHNLDHAGVVLGLGVRVDFQNAGVPSHSFANQQVQGILGLGRYDSFSLLDGATDGEELLAVGVGVIERGEIASETAAGASGFISISLRNADSDPIWQFYNKTRTRDYTHLALIRSLRLRLGRDNVTPHAIQAVMNDMTAVLIALKQHEATIGFKVGFDPSVNSPENLRLGQFRVYFKSEEPAPITQITIDSLPDRDALVVELQDIVAAASSLITG